MKLKKSKVSKKEQNSFKALVFRYIAEQLSEQALHYFRLSCELDGKGAITQRKNGNIYIDLKKLKRKVRK